MLNDLSAILERKEKKYFLIITLMMIVAGLLEVISLGILIPFISFLINPEAITANSYVVKYIPKLALLDFYSQLIFSLCFIFIIFFLKALYLSLYHYKKNKFVYDISDNISIKLFSYHIVRPYSFHLENNSSNVILNCINEVAIFVDGVLLAGLEFVSEVVLIFFVVTLLFIVNPVVSIFVSIVGLLLFLIFQGLTRRRLKKWSFFRQSTEEQMIEKVQQGFNGIKEITVFLKERFFIEAYSKATKTRSTIHVKYQTLLDTPKIILELVAIIVFTVMIFLILKANKNLQYFIPIIGLYVAASYKLLPALNRIIVSAQKFKRSSSTTLSIMSQLKDYEKNKKVIDKILIQNEIIPLNLKKNIILKNISFKYPGKNNFVFKNINLNIRKGETIGIIGRSGAGKSTLVNILCGFIVPETGSILVDDIDIQKNLREWRATFGYIPQLTYLFNDTISNNISFYSDDKVSKKVKLEETIKMAQLESLIKEIPLHEETIIGERGVLLSGGEAQRIALARTIYKNPQILILDEATSSLDFENEKKILDTIKSFKGKKTIIIVSHRKSTLSFCDKIYKVENQECTLVPITSI